MGIVKCKMCGGDLNLIEGVSTAECQFCGSVQTVPEANANKIFGQGAKLKKDSKAEIARLEEMLGKLKLRTFR